MTPAQQNFARLVAGGASYAEAYRSAYPRSRSWKEGTARKRASELMQHGDISGTVEKLRREANGKAVMECEELRTILTARVRELAEAHAPTRDLCRASDSLARVSGWYLPAAQAVAVSAVSMTPEERERRINDILGIPNEPPRELTPEERARKWRECLGFPEPQPEPSMEELERRHRNFLATLHGGDEPRPEPPPPPALPPPRPVEASERTDIVTGDGGEVEARESVHVSPPVNSAPGLTSKQARILARVERVGCRTVREVRAVASTFPEDGGATADDVDAVSDAWEAKHTEGDES